MDDALDSSAHVPDLTPFAVDSLWLNTIPAARTLLVVYAHPDDESFGSAGTIARYVSMGIAVHYVCATRGESGTVAPAFLEGHADIATLRMAELACAARALGLAAVHYLGYRDSGMAGTPDNQHPLALVQAPLARVTGQIVALMRVLRPQVVLTFGPYGGYGHPDHIAIYRATLAAFKVAGDPTHDPDHLSAGLQPWTPSKLYYPTFGPRLLKINIALLRLFRKDPRRFGENRDVDLLRAALETTPITTSIDSRAYLMQKERAWHCHGSQIGPRTHLRRLPPSVRRRVVGTEYFTRAIPAWRREERRENDLFSGVGEH